MTPTPSAAPAEANWLTEFDIAVADELRHVSSVPYNSREICQWFSERVRQRLAVLDAPKGEPTAEPELSMSMFATSADYHAAVEAQKPKGTMYRGACPVCHGSDPARQLTEASNRGYAKGLEDGKAIAAAQPSPTMADAKCEEPIWKQERRLNLIKASHEMQTYAKAVAQPTAIAVGEPTAPFGTEGEDAPDWMRKIARDIAYNYSTAKGRCKAHQAEIIEAMQGAASTALRASSAGTPHGAREPMPTTQEQRDHFFGCIQQAAMNYHFGTAAFKDFVMSVYDSQIPPDAREPASWRDVIKRARDGLAAGNRSISATDFEIEYGGALIDSIEEGLEALASSAGTPHGAREPESERELFEAFWTSNLLSFAPIGSREFTIAWTAWQNRAALKAREPSEDAKDAARVPMTDEQIWEIWREGYHAPADHPANAVEFDLWFARAIEAFHGIGQSAKEKQ